MKNLLKMGGIAALIGAATNLLGLGVFVAFLAPKGFGSEDLDPGQIVALLADNMAIMRVYDQIMYLVFGVCLIFLALALYERLKAGSPALAQAVTTFGLIWAVVVIVNGTLAINNLSTVVKLYSENPAQAETVWLTLELCGSRFGRRRRGNDGFRLVASTARLGSLAGKGASQGIELPWRGGRCSRHPLGCPDLAWPDGCLCLWIGSHHLVRLARDRHVAQQSGQDSDERAVERGIDLH